MKILVNLEFFYEAFQNLHITYNFFKKMRWLQYSFDIEWTLQITKTLLVWLPNPKKVVIENRWNEQQEK